MPFALVVMPDSDSPVFYASTPDELERELPKVESFGVMPYSLDGTDVKPIWIKKSLTPEQVLTLSMKYPAPPISPEPEGTDYADYKIQVDRIISYHKAHGGKTVLSRLISLSSGRSLVDVVDEYFTLFAGTLRFFYLLPDYGIWFGASPEVLLTYDKHTAEIGTMSLAGTRSVYGHAGMPWDHKNIEEHKMVTDYILHELKSAGATPEIYDNTSLQYGDIEHLCDRIKAHWHGDPTVLLHRLSPTPALCGWPKDVAYSMIAEAERHKRHCYAGWIAVSEGAKLTAYVNLRSAFASIEDDGQVLYNIYAGGGVTADSVAEDEWLETTAKAARLIKIITENDGDYR